MATSVLICGDVRGRLGRLYQRVSAATSAANAPFSCVFCVGEFFPLDGDGDDAGVDIAEYVAGRASAPLPTYFLGGKDTKGVQWISAMGGKSLLCPNIFYLGDSGVRELHGLQVGFVSGCDDDVGDGSDVKSSANEDALFPLVKAVTADGDKYEGLDLLLSSQWPQHVHALDSLGGNPGPKAAPHQPSCTVACAAAILRPRYHLAAFEGVAWSRAAYENASVPHVTRFIALGSVSMKKGGDKYLHALKLTPLAAISAAELWARPAALTIDPLAKAGRVISQLPSELVAAHSDGLLGEIFPSLRKRAAIDGGGDGGGGGGGGEQGNGKRARVQVEDERGEEDKDEDEDREDEDEEDREDEDDDDSGEDGEEDSDDDDEEESDVDSDEEEARRKKKERDGRSIKASAHRAGGSGGSSSLLSSVDELFSAQQSAAPSFLAASRAARASRGEDGVEILDYDAAKEAAELAALAAADKAAEATRMLHAGHKHGLAKGLSSRLGRASNNNINKPGSVSGSNFSNYS